MQRDILGTYKLMQNHLVQSQVSTLTEHLEMRRNQKSHFNTIKLSKVVFEC